MNLFIYFKTIFYHVTLENIFRILNNSVYFQNIVVCNEPFRACEKERIHWKSKKHFKDSGGNKQFKDQGCRTQGLPPTKTKRTLMFGMKRCRARHKYAKPLSKR